MKKKQLDEELQKKVENDGLESAEEPLDLDELLEIQGGVENDGEWPNCGLGCFLNGIY